MVDLDCSKLPSNSKSPRLSSKLQISIPAPKPRRSELEPASDSACSSYEAYLHLPELRKLWAETEFPDWRTEAVLRPALTGLEITFRFISTVLSDPRPYSDKREWTRRLEALVGGQAEIIALLLEAEEEDDEARGRIPIVDLTSTPGVLSRENSSAEVWKSSSEDRVVVSHVSAESLLPRLATWTTTKHEDVWRRIQHQIECQMMRCRSCTLGLGEPNLAGKPSLDYDALCRPSSVHALTKKKDGIRGGDHHLKNHEDRTLRATHQILESWICAAKHLLERIGDAAARGIHRRASTDCWVLEKVWSLLSHIENLHLLMDPDDFLRLKNQLMIETSHEEKAAELFCFRSRGLVDVTRSSKDLKHKVPEILGVEVDPTGGPRIQDSAMELYRRRKEESAEKIHLLQAMQAVEAALKRFYFGYKQVLAVVMGSLEVKSSTAGDVLTDIITEPTYFPSLDGAKTFLGEWWSLNSSNAPLS